ncbi:MULTISPECIES: VOC family protein [unclassified Methylobacterium]|jgi:lactoylglutathione lyase|uniref:VOC family protein n=1 Tax=unclassified Methylobacterium TaxID=2615210 RepID=UPI0005B7E124|nr:MULTISPECIES: VOC family protein [unclassified Methylobacterium]MDE4909595.1 VOC family protein [Methylobacterium sp. 092160098-2]SFV11192.1 lactoylglutathione lyase [Methylobacterium sp. UNCCL125]
MGTKLVHSMIRVLDDIKSIAFYDQVLGLKVADRLDFDGFSLIYLRNELSPFELEFTVNHDRTERYQLGDGYGHLAVTVDSLEAEHERLSSAGISVGPIREFKHRGAILARFFFITDPDGYKIEVIERGGRFV